MSFWPNNGLGRSYARRAKFRVGASASTTFSSTGLRRLRGRPGGEQVRLGAAQLRRELILVELGRMSPSCTRAVDFDTPALMMPLALDLISIW